MVESFIVFLLQLSYAIKNQLKACKIPPLRPCELVRELAEQFLGPDPDPDQWVCHLESHKYFSREEGQRAIGCPGLDTPFSEWPLKTRNSPIYASPALDCPKTSHHNLAGIVESYANDQQFWSGEKEKIL